jgi:hypothetical protein
VSDQRILVRGVSSTRGQRGLNWASIARLRMTRPKFQWPSIGWTAPWWGAQMTPLRRDLIGSVICSLAGVILCALPHAIWYVRLGEPVWAADQDELYYLGVAAQAFHEHPLWLGDPTRDIGHSLYQRLPLLPGIWIARLLGLGPQLYFTRPLVRHPQTVGN